MVDDSAALSPPARSGRNNKGIGFHLWFDCLHPLFHEMEERAGSPLTAAVANPRVRVDHDGAHGVTRPT